MIKKFWSRQFLFKKGHNNFVRICKKCGAIQEQFCWAEENIDMRVESWWEEMSEGNDPSCPCHKRADHNHLPGW